MPEISTIKNLCSLKKWAKVHQNHLRPATPKTRIMPNFIEIGQNSLEKNVTKIFVPQGTPWTKGHWSGSWCTSTPPLATWKISYSSVDPSPRYLLPNLVDFVAGVTDKKHTVNDMSPHYGDNNKETHKQLSAYFLARNSSLWFSLTNQWRLLVYNLPCMHAVQMSFQQCIIEHGRKMSQTKDTHHVSHTKALTAAQQMQQRDRQTDRPETGGYHMYYAGAWYRQQCESKKSINFPRKKPCIKNQES